MPSFDPGRPNILFILSDDQGYWAMGCAGNEEIKTPHLDRLAQTGTRLSHLFCASPVCSPARASILTGRIPSQHGIHDWLRGGNYVGEPGPPGHPIEYLKGQTAYTDLLSAAGWTCGLSGKWHMGDSGRPQKGFTYWEVHATGGSNYYGGPMIHDGKLFHEPRYLTDVFTDNALSFLEQQRGNAAPFYLSVHYTAPHSPWGRDQHPKELYDDYHANCPFHSTPFVPPHPWQINSAPCGFDEESRRAVLSGYYAAVTAMDYNIGRLLDWLEANGLRENTLVIFTSDNGMNMGHHGLFGKGNATFPMNMYDTSVRVPCIISRPGHVPQGAVCDAMLSHYDFMPTLLDYVGLPNPVAEDLPGVSFAPVLRGEPMPEREDVVVFDEYGPVRMIRTATHKYVHRYPYGPHEFYDLTADPDENQNLVNDPDAAGQIRELRGRLETWFARYVHPLMDGAREGVTGRGQVNLAGPAAEGHKAYVDDWQYLDPRRRARSNYSPWQD